MLLTGLAVEIALIPFALYHFHKAGLFGVLANLVAIPLTTFVIMPLEAGALLLDIIGIGEPLWWGTGKALGGLIWIAHSVAGARGAVATLASMPAWAFAAMVAGGLWLALWTTRARLLGLIPFVIGASAAAFSPTPDVLITGDGSANGVETSGATLSARRPVSTMSRACCRRRHSDPVLAMRASLSSAATDASSGCSQRDRRRRSIGRLWCGPVRRWTSLSRIAGFHEAVRRAG